MIADIVIEPMTGEFDVTKLESYLAGLPLVAPDPRVPHHFFSAFARDILDEAIAKRAADGSSVGPSVMLIAVSARSVNIVNEARDAEVAREFVLWLRRHYQVSFRDNDYGDDVPEVDDKLEILFGPVQPPRIGNYDENGFFVLNDPHGLLRELLDALVTKNNPWCDQLVKRKVPELRFAGLLATETGDAWSIVHEGREGLLLLTAHQIDELTDVAWQFVHNYRSANALEGATLDQGRYELEENLAGDPDRGLYRGRDRSRDARVLISLGLRQAEAMQALRDRFDFEVPGIAALQYIGPVEAPDATTQHDGLIEAEPAGAPTSFLIDRLDAVGAARLGLAIAEVVAAAHARGRVLVGMRPELVYLDGDRVTGIAPRCELFHATMARTSQGSMPAFSHCFRAPEVLAFPKKPATPAADVFSLAAMIAKWHTGMHPFAGEHTANFMAVVAGTRTPWHGDARLGTALAPALAPLESRSTLAQLTDVLRSIA